MSKLGKAQIGAAGELFVQFKLLLQGIESSRLPTDAGIDLVTYSKRVNDPLAIQVKSNLKAKPAGGRGKYALDWWVPDDTPADLIAFVDISGPRVWLMAVDELAESAQQHSNGRYHLYMYVDPTYRPRDSDRLAHVYEFEKYLLENRIHNFF